MPRFSRMVLILLLALVLAATAGLAQPLAGAGPRLPGLAVSTSSDLLGQLWIALSRLWSKNGCEFDPSGRCLAQGSNLAPVDNGCSVDPDGRCLAQGSNLAPLDNGCDVDPDGRCSR